MFDYNKNVSFKKNAINKKVVCITDADPSKRGRNNGGKFVKCNPYELDEDNVNFEYQAICRNLKELKSKYKDHLKVKICSRTDGKGKTLEYDLAFDNPNCKLLLTDNLTKKAELENLIDAYNDGNSLLELLKLSTTKTLNHAIDFSKWAEDEKKRALIASRYLQSVENSQEGGKGSHALELEYNLRNNLKCEDPIKFIIPKHLKKALKFVCC